MPVPEFAVTWQLAVCGYSQHEYTCIFPPLPPLKGISTPLLTELINDLAAFDGRIAAMSAEHPINIRPRNEYLTTEIFFIKYFLMRNKTARRILL